MGEKTTFTTKDSCKQGLHPGSHIRSLGNQVLALNSSEGATMHTEVAFGSAFALSFTSLALGAILQPSAQTLLTW